MAETLARRTRNEAVSETPTECLESRHRRHVWLLLAGVLDGLWVFNLLTLVRYPAPTADEADIVGHALQFVRGGELGGFGTALSSESAGRFWTEHWLLAPWLQALFVRWLGLSLYSMRVVSLVCGIVLLVAVFTIAHRLHGPRAGFLSVVLVAFSSEFLIASHLALVDIMVAAFGYGAVALAVASATSTRRLTALLAGLSAACATSIDPSGIIFVPAALLALTIASFATDWSRRACWLLIGFAAAALNLIVIPMVVWHRLGMGTASGSTWASLFAGLSLGSSLSAAAENVAWFGIVSNARTPLIIAAIGLLLWSAPRGLRTGRAFLPALFALLFFGYLIVHPGESATGEIFVSPAADLLVAILLVRGLDELRAHSSRLAKRPADPTLPRHERTPAWRKPRTSGQVALAFPGFGAPRSRAILAGVAWLLAATSIIWSMLPLRTDEMGDFVKTAEWIQAQVPPNSRLVGDRALWFAFPDQSFVAWQDLESTAGVDQPGPLEDEVQSRRPDYIVVGLTRSPLVSESFPVYGSRDQGQRDRIAAVNALASRFAIQVEEFHTDSLGTVRAYRMDWR